MEKGDGPWEEENVFLLFIFYLLCVWVCMSVSQMLKHKIFVKEGTSKGNLRLFIVNNLIFLGV